MREPLLGLHVSIAGSLDAAFDRATEVGCTTFQMFTRNPRGWRFKPLSKDQVSAFLEKRKKSGFEKIVDHMPYLPNLASPDRGMMKASRRTLDAEIKRCDALGLDYLVAHLGSHMGKGTMVGIKNVAEAFSEAISGSSGETTLLLENMAGQKNSVGARFEELKQILDLVKKSERAAVCFDTCMPPGSFVLSNGIPSQIETVGVGDQVLDSEGNSTFVTRVMNRPYAGELVSVKPAGFPWITTTPEHPLLCVSANRIKYLEVSPWRVRVTDAPSWIAAGNAKVGIYLLMPKPKSAIQTIVDFGPYIGENTRRMTFPRQMILSENMATLFGLYLAEGFTFLGKGLRARGGDNGKVYLAFGKHEKDLVKLSVSLFDTLFGLTAWVDEAPTTTRVCAGSNVLSRFFRDQFGGKARSKKVPPFIMFAEARLIRAFLLGFLKGDGCVDASGIRFVTSSELVANQLVLLLSKLDIRGTLRPHPPTVSTIEGRLIHGKGWFEVRVGRGDSRKLGFEYKLPSAPQRTVLKTPNLFLVPIRRIRKEYYRGLVYNLTTESGSFMAPLVVTHNCHAFAAGFDLAGPAAVDNTMALFDECVGLDRIKVVHLNDSKGPIGSNLDRHENIGEGKIGERGFRSFLHYKGITDRPLILETPYSDVRTMKESLATVRRLLK